MNEELVQRALDRLKEIRKIMDDAREAGKEMVELGRFLTLAHELYPDAFDEWPIPGIPETFKEWPKIGRKR